MEKKSLLKKPLPYWKWFLFNFLFFLLTSAGDWAADVLQGHKLPQWWVFLIFLAGDILLSLLFAYFDMLLFNPPTENCNETDTAATAEENDNDKNDKS